jgi:hypothetical protein
MIELYEQQVAETRRMNTLLERIAVSLEAPLARSCAHCRSHGLSVLSSVSRRRF